MSGTIIWLAVPAALAALLIGCAPQAHEPKVTPMGVTSWGSCAPDGEYAIDVVADESDLGQRVTMTVPGAGLQGRRTTTLISHTGYVQLVTGSGEDTFSGSVAEPGMTLDVKVEGRLASNVDAKHPTSRPTTVVHWPLDVYCPGQR